MEVMEHQDGCRYRQVPGQLPRFIRVQLRKNDTREIFENGQVLNYTGNPRALFEQQNQKLCYEALKFKNSDKEPLSLELIREVHRILTSGTYDERRYIVNGERPGIPQGSNRQDLG